MFFSYHIHEHIFVNLLAIINESKYWIKSNTRKFEFGLKSTCEVETNKKQEWLDPTKIASFKH